MIPAWIEALRPRAGVLIKSAQPLLREAFPRSRDGLGELCAHLDAFVFDDSEKPLLISDESQFVEAAGSLLALLLIDHVGSGHYATRDSKHRIALGKRGFFDPFSAIQNAIDAKSPKKFLMTTVALAEEEARGEGPVSRVANVFAERLAQLRSDLSVLDHFESRMWLNEEIEVDLHRVITATRGESHASVVQSIDKLIAMLPGGPESAGLLWSEAALRALPRLVAKTFAPPGMTKGQSPLLTMEFAGDIDLAFVLGYEGRSRYVRSDELLAWEKDADTLRAQAIANLVEKSMRARFEAHDTEHGKMIAARTGDGLDSARVLLPTLFDVLSASLGENILVGIPHRDTLLATAHVPTSPNASFFARVKDDAARAPHRISDTIFLLTRAGIRAADIAS